jgi:hypothetical protein
MRAQACAETYMTNCRLGTLEQRVHERGYVAQAPRQYQKPPTEQEYDHQRKQEEALPSGKVAEKLQCRMQAVPEFQ